MTAPTAAHGALARLRNELTHYVFCPSQAIVCTCPHFADLALLTRRLTALERVAWTARAFAEAIEAAHATGDTVRLHALTEALDEWEKTT